MRIAFAAVVLCACPAPAAKEPRPDLSQLHPDPAVTEAPPEPVAFPAFPTIGAMPAAHPIGDPIKVPSRLPAVDDVERQTTASTFEQHYVDSQHDATRYQRTERHFDLRVRVLAVEADHPAKLEVTADVATEAVTLGDSPNTARRTEQQLLGGTYVVTAGPGGGFERDEGQVSRPGGAKVYGREQEEVGMLFGNNLRAADPVLRFFQSRPLRVGDAVVLDDEGKRAVAGAEPMPGTFVVSVPSATATTVTYELDVETKTADLEVRLQGSVTFDRATGRLLAHRQRTHKIERDKSTVDDTFTDDTFAATPAAK